MWFNTRYPPTAKKEQENDKLQMGNGKILQAAEVSNTEPSPRASQEKQMRRGRNPPENVKVEKNSHKLHRFFHH